jgi:iron complex outermembrane receptor protein
VGDRNAAGTTLYKVNAEFSATHDASIRYRSDQWSITAGITNLFDEHPPTLTGGGVLGQYSTAGTALLASQYDAYYQGRRGFVQLSRSW